MDNVEPAINFYLRGHYPPIKITQVESLPDNCSIQIIPSCYFNVPQFHSPRVKQQISEASEKGLYHRRATSGQYLKIPQNHIESKSLLGDLLPPLLAMSLGYYGSLSERLRASMVLINILRGSCSCVGLFTIVLLLSTSAFTQSLRLSTIFSSLRYILTVLAITTILSLVQFCYGSIWLYNKAKCKDPNQVFLSTVPSWIPKHFKKFTLFGYYGENIQALFSISASSVIFTISNVLNGSEDLVFKRRLLICGVLSLFLCLFLLLNSKFTTKLYMAGAAAQFQLPSCETPKLNNEGTDKRTELVKFLVKTPTTTQVTSQPSKKLVYNNSADIKTHGNQTKLPKRAETAVVRS